MGALADEIVFYHDDQTYTEIIMGSRDEDTAAEGVVRKNEKFNVPDQTEKEEAESHEDAPVENLADDGEIKRRRKHT